MQLLDNLADDFPAVEVKLSEYPDALIGNDDPITTDEDANPYSGDEALEKMNGEVEEGGLLKPAIGQLAQYDAPNVFALRIGSGVEGETA